MNEITSIFKATHGVMTEEVGVISGDLELKTGCKEDGSLTLQITYVGAKDLYTLPGSPYQLHDPNDHDVVHQILVNILERT